MGRIAFESPLLRDDFRRASRQTQAKIESFIRKFGEDADRAGIRLKSPATAGDPRVKVARVDQGLRAVLIDLGEGEYVLVRVMEHDAAYAWAGALRPDVSSFDGRPRLLHLSVVEQAAAAPAISVDTSVFAHRSDADFETVGVPPFIVSALRGLPTAQDAVDLAELAGEADPLLGFAIHGLLDPDRPVEEVFDELVALEGGPSPEDPRADGVLNGADAAPRVERSFDTEDLAAALERPGSDERFRVVEDSEELVAALHGEFAAWQIFLHPLQRQAAYSTRFSGPARVSGGAGTGKTVVLLHRAKALLDRAAPGEEPRILLTTYTSHLQRDLAGLLRQLVGKDRADLVDVRTVDGLARDLHRRMSGAEVKELLEPEELRLWDAIAESHGDGRSAAFLRSEYRHVVLARGIRTLDGYLDVARVGRGVRLPSPQRRALWPVFEAFEIATRQCGRFTTLQLTEAVAALLEQLPSQTYDHVLVDEAQDLHASQWRLLRAITAQGADDLFLVGDAFQRIYGDTVSLRSLGIETRGRSLRLRRNYRTTKEIAGWALGIVGADTIVDLDELGADLTGYHSVRRGPSPRFEAFPSREAEVSGVAGIVAQWMRAGHEPGAIVVLSRTKSDLPELLHALAGAGVPAGLMGRNGRVDAMVNVATMHRIKGLEFPCVAVTGLSAGFVPPPGRVCSATEDPRQHDDDLQAERSLIYVAATRARDELVVSWHGAPSPLIERAMATSARAGSPQAAGVR
jgi:hypothetical protein